MARLPYLTVDELYDYCLGPSVVRAQYCELHVTEGDRYSGGRRGRPRNLGSEYEGENDE